MTLSFSNQIEGLSIIKHRGELVLRNFPARSPVDESGILVLRKEFQSLPDRVLVIPEFWTGVPEFVHVDES